jgi:hypothetical protein
MAETPEAPKAPDTTPITDWLVPNQDKLEQVIDARLAAHAENEGTEKKTSRSRSTSASAGHSKDEPKS